MPKVIVQPAAGGKSLKLMVSDTQIPLLHRRFANLVSPERSRMQIAGKNSSFSLSSPQDVVVGPRVCGMERKTSIWPATGAVTSRTHSGRAERCGLTRSNGSLATNDTELIQCYYTAENDTHYSTTGIGAW